MKENDILKDYTPSEERLNILTHLFGLILSTIGLYFLIQKAIMLDKLWATFSFTIFGLSMIILYLASTLYHASTKVEKRKRLKVFDHIAIYLLIAGSYTPFTLVSLENHSGWTVFYIVWGFALIGIIIKLFFTGKFDIISTLMYVFMGWMIVFSFNDLKETVPSLGIDWLVAGGIAYTVGAILYSIKKIPYNHAIFHLFVLLGTFCHYIAIVKYIQ